MKGAIFANSSNSCAHSLLFSLNTKSFANSGKYRFKSTPAVVVGFATNMRPRFTVFKKPVDPWSELACTKRENFESSSARLLKSETNPNTFILRISGISLDVTLSVNSSPESTMASSIRPRSFAGSGCKVRYQMSFSSQVSVLIGKEFFWASLRIEAWIAWAFAVDKWRTGNTPSRYRA